MAAACLLLSACTAARHGAGAASGSAAAGSPPSPTAAAPTASTTTVPPTTTTTVPPTTTTAVPAGWSAVSQVATGPAVEQKTVRTADGASVVLLRFEAGRTVFDLHVGSTDPPGGAGVPASAAPAVSAAQRPVLLAAFNGGFKTDTGSGGFEVDGIVLKPLVAGYASLVIDNGGRARVAVWGQDAPQPGESIASVRQNLVPLIRNGSPAADISSINAWGATLYGANSVARSALCSDAGGNLVYAGSTRALPVDLSTALTDAGCTTAMELDINPEWVQADVAAAPGAPLTAAIPGQSRPTSQYLTGWTRDFVTVQAAP
ncbi:MAG TPA: hypothetical protein VFN68_02675 [Acidimicrobiales bacterium]|nr:hypothetical protein [Acidimicrobiales bacterium]